MHIHYTWVGFGLEMSNCESISLAITLAMLILTGCSMMELYHIVLMFDESFRISKARAMATTFDWKAFGRHKYAMSTVPNMDPNDNCNCSYYYPQVKQYLDHLIYYKSDTDSESSSALMHLSSWIMPPPLILMMSWAHTSNCKLLYNQVIYTFPQELKLNQLSHLKICGLNRLFETTTK